MRTKGTSERGNTTRKSIRNRSTFTGKVLEKEHKQGNKLESRSECRVKNNRGGKLDFQKGQTKVFLHCVEAAQPGR